MNLAKSYKQPVDNFRHAVLTSTFVNVLDTSGTLKSRAYSEAQSEPLKRLVRSVLIAIGIALCSASPAGQATTLQQITPFRYATFQVGELQASCLFKIAVKESNIRYTAVNRSSGAYGAFQLLDSRAKGASPLKQVELAIDYANYRYGSACNAWSAWQRKSWW